MNTRIVDEEKLFDKIADIVDHAENTTSDTDRAFREGQIEALAMVSEGQVDVEGVDNPEYPLGTFDGVLGL